VKIDKDFVRKIPTRNTSREIVAGIIVLCQKLELDCVLEGVETQSELDQIEALGPTIVQGHLFGKPMPAQAAPISPAAASI
jgi:EAL domain-containing protein (putative c-di-GMP-specific phosphodiesterase class I)